MAKGYSVKEARQLLEQAMDLRNSSGSGCSSVVYAGDRMVLKTFKKIEHAKHAYKAQSYAASYDAAPKVYGKIKEIKLRTGRKIYGFFSQKVSLKHPYLKNVPDDHIVDLRFQMLNLFEDLKGKMDLRFLGDIHHGNVGHDEDMGMILIDFHANIRHTPFFCSVENFRATPQERKAFKREWIAPFEKKAKTKAS